MTPRRLANLLLAAFTVLMLGLAIAILGALLGYWRLP